MGMGASRAPTSCSDLSISFSAETLGVLRSLSAARIRVRLQILVLWDLRPPAHDDLAVCMGQRDPGL